MFMKNVEWTAAEILLYPNINLVTVFSVTHHSNIFPLCSTTQTNIFLHIAQGYEGTTGSWGGFIPFDLNDFKRYRRKCYSWNQQMKLEFQSDSK